MAKLFIVSTPIGNLQDITLRAIDTLKNADVIACEDTRKTGMLLVQLNIAKKQLISYYEENEQLKIPEIIQLIKSGKNIALVSNAGTPTISDPGYKLIRVCINQGIIVETIPGPSALLTALVSSGLPTDKFMYLGFLPEKQGKKTKYLENLKTIEQPASRQGGYSNITIVFYESPYRLVKTLVSIQEVFGDIDIVICRELTKVFEEIRREKVSQAITHFEKVKPKGEFTIVMNLIGNKQEQNRY